MFNLGYGCPKVVQFDVRIKTVDGCQVIRNFKSDNEWPGHVDDIEVAYFMAWILKEGLPGSEISL